MAKRRTWTGPVPSDENRCTRNDGKNWRCYAPRSPNSIFCPKHHLNYLSKCRSNPPKPPSIRGPHKPPSKTLTLTLNPGQIWALSSSSSSSSSSQSKLKTPRHHHHYFRVDQTLPTLLATPLLPHPVLPEEIQFATKPRHHLSCGTFRPAPAGPKSVPASAFAFRMFGVKTVTWMRIPFYRIFPNKGEVWIVDGGKEGGGDRMVEVVSEFAEEEGVTAAELAEVEGKGDGVYGRSSVRVFGRREMVLFSRRVEVERVGGADDGEQQLWKVMA